MFEVFVLAGWAITGILLLYLWADVRELKRDLKSCRRDLTRNSLGGRTSRDYPGFSEEDYWREMGQRIEAAEPDMAEPGKAGEKKNAVLKPGEEQALWEVLAEFLS